MVWRLGQNMDYLNCICWMFTAVTIANVVSGQVTVTGPVDTAVESGNPAQLVCSVTGDSGTPVFIWNDLTVDPTVTIFASGESTSNLPKYTNFGISESIDANGGTSTSTITVTNTAIEDEGQYGCQVSSENPDPATISVEVRSTLTVNISSPLRAMEEATAQCDAVGGRPQETLAWYINNVEQTTGIVVTNPPNPTQGLSNTRSVLTFTPTRDNDEQSISCRITGHSPTLADLNQEESTTLNVQFPPVEGSLTVQISRSDNELTIDCLIDASMQPNPFINLYNISANDTQIASSSISRTTYSPLPEYDTEFTCTASNGLGDISASRIYEVAGTTTPPPTTGTPTNTAAIVGGVVGGGAVVIVIVLIWYFCCKRGDCGGACTCCPDLECCPDGNCCLCCPCCDPEDPPKPVGGGSGGGKDNRVSGMATYNTSDPEKAPPVAKPRSTVQHDTNNPGGDMYAMVDKGGRGDRDYPDAGRNGRGQPADPQLTYADLDLSARKEVHIPKDEKEVVVYSSIVV